MKTSLIIIGLVLLVGLVVLGLQPDEPVTPSVSDTPRGPSFEVRVVKPRSARFLFGLLPDGLFGSAAAEQWFDHTSRGAEVGRVEPEHLELGADGWDFFLETDGEGRVTGGTRLVFSVDFGDRQPTLRCRPADEASGYLRTTARADSEELDGDFLVELAVCENAESGKVIAWPPQPLTVRGSFVGLAETRT